MVCAYSFSEVSWQIFVVSLNSILRHNTGVITVYYYCKCMLYAPNFNDKRSLLQCHKAGSEPALLQFSLFYVPIDGFERTPERGF